MTQWVLPSKWAKWADAKFAEQAAYERYFERLRHGTREECCRARAVYWQATQERQRLS
jgi:hypothetical protein